jgi:hypothetical protein
MNAQVLRLSWLGLITLLILNVKDHHAGHCYPLPQCMVWYANAVLHVAQ